MKTLLRVLMLCVPLCAAQAQSTLDQLTIKSGEMGGRGGVWEVSGTAPETGVLIEVAATAQPIMANVSNDMAPSPDWFLYFFVEVTNERSASVVFTKRYEFKPRGGLVKAADTVNITGQGGRYRTTFRFDTEKIGGNSRAQVIRITEGSVRTSAVTYAIPADAPGAEKPKKPRFKVD